jgi:hypothetical protein
LGASSTTNRFLAGEDLVTDLAFGVSFLAVGFFAERTLGVGIFLTEAGFASAFLVDALDTDFLGFFFSSTLSFSYTIYF